MHINSTLALGSTTVQLYVWYLGYTAMGTCYPSTYDFTYTTGDPTYGNPNVDLGCVQAGNKGVSSSINFAGTPFTIANGPAAFTQTRCWDSVSSCLGYTCSSSQTCSNAPYCNGRSLFNGLLGLYNQAQYQTDVSTACALYPGDAQLACSGNDILCSNPCPNCVGGTISTAAGLTTCTSCTQGTYSRAGLSACVTCAAGSFASAVGLSACAACAVGLYAPSAALSACRACPQGSTVRRGGPWRA